MLPPWPEIRYDAWRGTCSALHMYAQVVGKYRLAHTPWVNHSWHATLYVNARGFTTSLVPDGPGGVEIVLDLIDHAVTGAATDGRTAGFRLAPMSVARFHDRFVRLIRELGGTPEFHGRPNEVQDPTAFTDQALGEFLLPYDVVRRSADPEAALTAFLESTYRAAADLGGWDRAALECAPGVPRVPRPV